MIRLLKISSLKTFPKPKRVCVCVVCVSVCGMCMCVCVRGVVCGVIVNQMGGGTMQIFS